MTPLAPSCSGCTRGYQKQEPRGENPWYQIQQQVRFDRIQLTVTIMPDVFWSSDEDDHVYCSKCLLMIPFTIGYQIINDLLLGNYRYNVLNRQILAWI